MSNNIDDLLDLGAMSSSPPSQAATGGTPPSADPFDPFATTTLEPSTETGKGTFTAFDPFATIEATSPEGPPQDPFGADPFYPSKTTTQNDTQQDLFGGGDFTADLLGGAAEPDKDLIGQDQSHTEVVMSAAVSQQDQKAYEAQFDDLLGGFSNSSSGNPLYELVNGDEAVSQNSLDAYDDEGGSRAPAENGEVVTVTEEHITEDGATTTVVTETHTTVTDDGVEYKTVTTTRESYGEQDEDNLDESFDQSDTRESSDGTVSPAPSDRSADAGLSSSDDGHSDSRSPTRIEDTLPSFQAPRQFVKKEEKREIKSSPGVFITGASGDNVCKVCQKRVYEMEKMIADKAIYHKMCFKCSHCRRILSLGNFASLDGNLYCKPHFIEIFKTKGNYEDGFGVERSSKPWAKEISPDSQESNLRTLQEMEDAVTGSEPTKGDERSEDNLENLPSIRNLKSRFEGKDNQAVSPTASLERRIGRPDSSQGSSSSESHYNGNLEDGDREILRETQMKEEVHFAEMNSVRSKFEDAGRQAGRVPMPSPSKSPSKWNRPKETTSPPPVVNRQDMEDGHAEEELPPAATTRNLVAKFRDIGSKDDYAYSPELKPVRRITPPREDLEHGVDEYRAQEEERHIERDPNIIRSGEDMSREDELPPPSYTKNLLAKFKSLENLEEAPPSPARSSSTTVRKTSSTKTSQLRQQSKSSPDSGISDSEGQQPLVNGTNRYDRESYQEVDARETYENEPAVNADVIKSGERTDEKELPEQGFTKSLLAQWRCKEQEGASRETSPAPKKTSRSWDSGRTQKARPLSQTSESDQSSPDEHMYRGSSPSHQQEVTSEANYANREVVRECDTNEEEYLPPPSYTKNLLAKFKTIQAEAEKEATTVKPIPKKQFKWTVKETRPLRGVPAARDGQSSSDDASRHSSSAVTPDPDQEMNGHAYEYHQSYEQEIVHADEATHGEEMPPPSLTRNLLAKFKSMEDLSQPPPSPERAYQGKTRTGGSSVGPVRQMASHDVSYSHEREQPEGGEYESSPDEYHQYEVAAEAGEFENEPQRNVNVIREDDRNDEAELPGQGTTRNLLAKFQSMQAS